MKILNKIFVFAALLTGAAVAGGEYLDMRWMYNLAAIGFGLMSVLGGFRIMIEGEAHGASVGRDFYAGNIEHAERHTGTRARMIGLLLLMAGPIIITLSVIELTTPGGMDEFWDEFLRSPRAWGLILGIAGFMITLMGIVRAKAGTGSKPGTFSETVEAEFKGQGIVHVIAGVVMMIAAAVLIVAPDLLQGTLDDLFSR